jgi:DNA-directed RNA polymerase subunit RPC12/RpoP
MECKHKFLVNMEKQQPNGLLAIVQNRYQCQQCGLRNIIVIKRH